MRDPLLTGMILPNDNTALATKFNAYQDDPDNGPPDRRPPPLEEKRKTPPRLNGEYSNIPVELFETESGRYAFDCRNVCFLRVDSLDFQMLSILREREASLEELVGIFGDYPESAVRAAFDGIRHLQSEGILAPYTFVRRSHHADGSFQEVLSERMAGFIVFITTACNLRCSYCIYGGQYEQHEKLSSQAMSWDTLRNTMEFLRDHSRRSEEIRVDFFGGEPLLAFDMLRRGVEYLKSIVDPGGPKVVVTITSNGTILDEKILDFLIEHDVYLQFSIDGAQAAHDTHRVFRANREGSFARIMDNLRAVHARSPEYFRKNMRLKGVLSAETSDDEQEFFSNPLIRAIAEQSNYTFLDLEPHYDLEHDAEYFDRLHALGRVLLDMEGLSSDADIRARLPVRMAALYRHTLGRFFGVQVVGQAVYGGQDSTPFTKGCLPGYQQGAVAANGDISICIKSAKGNNFVIGNVNEGQWYYQKMQHINKVLCSSWLDCESCYIQKFCDLCYEKISGETGHLTASINKFCAFNREKHRLIFEYMLRVCEKNPELWRHVEQVVREEREKRGKQDGHEDDALP